MGVFLFGFVLGSFARPETGATVRGAAESSFKSPVTISMRYDFSGVASSRIDFVRQVIANNSIRLVHQFLTSTSRRSMLVHQTRQSGSLISGWLPNYTVALRGGRVLVMRHCICHDPATDTSYCAEIAEVCVDSGLSAARRGGRRWEAA